MNGEISEFWAMVTSDDIQTKESGLQKWKEFNGNNPQYFEWASEKLPKGFAKDYKKINPHDFQILQIQFDGHLSRGAVLKLFVYDFHEDYGKDIFYEIVYRGVKGHAMTVCNTEYRLTWGYDIFDICDNGLWIHRILCADGASIEVTFKSISIKKQKSSSIIS